MPSKAKTTKAATTAATSKSAPQPLNTLSAAAAAKAIAAGRISSEALVADCLARIEEREPKVRAWEWLDREHALQQARALDRELRKAGPRGPLHGVPIGIKDVIDTADMPTGMGSSIYDGHRPRADAACVAMMRRAGAVILGKTVTCELAGVAPRQTMNPHDPLRTPGGSSSGSGAAVADFHVPVAFGTQTGGSVLRPASFCGVIGYKPTYNLINRAGLKFAAEGVDTIGFIARTVEDVALVTDACVGRRHKPMAKLKAPPRIGLCRTFLWDEKAQPETKAAVDAAARQAEKAGARVVPVELPSGFDKLTGVRDIVNNVERAMGLAWEWDVHRDQLSPQMVRTVEQGLSARRDDYTEAVRLAERCRLMLDELMADHDVLLAPAVNGEAPLGLEYAGDPAFQSIWTLLHVPTITLPLAKGPHGMPVGVQLVAARHADRTLLEAARWIMSIGA